MSFSTGLTTLVGVLGLANLLLALGLTRRVTEHDQRLDHLSRPGPEPLPDLGEHVGAFQTTTVDGTPLSEADRTPGTAVGFFDAA
ncbi:hypothetical protein [Catenulispora subtropica]|uniref:Uncharacterized protein n=1 Tax=Catenulispora subtropica TaxID=450798 RepID=A0ABN2T3B8_9ACTN